MGEQKIARTVAEAQVGDLLWRYDGNQNRYDENYKWLGRGVWDLVTVLKVARVYVTAGNPECPRAGREFRIETGQEKTANGHTPSCHVAGSKERAEQFWRDQAADMGHAISRTKNIEVLKTVAFALGIDGPPDFSTPALNREEAERG